MLISFLQLYYQSILYIGFIQTSAEIWLFTKAVSLLYLTVKSIYLTIGFTSFPNSSIDFIIISWAGSPTSIWPIKRVIPKISFI